MWKTIIIFWFLILVLQPVSGFGAEVEGLYQAEVRVYSQKTSERTAAMSTALTEVLAKVNGRSIVLSVDAVKQAIRKPGAFLQLYRYRDLSAEEQRSLSEEQSQYPDISIKGEPQMVVFSFDKIAVDKLLSDNGLPNWGATRPSIVAWLAVQDEQGRYLVGGDIAEPLGKTLAAEARRRGLPLLLPLMDLEDQRSLRFADVWAGFSEPVLNASSRYRTEAVLIGRLYPGLGETWEAKWTVLEGRISKSWEVQGESREAVIRAGVSGATELLAARYAPALNRQQAGMLPLMIVGVRTLGDYSRVSDYLASLQQVAQVQITQVEPDRVYFDLVIEAAPEGIAKTIALGNVLTPTEITTAEITTGINQPDLQQDGTAVTLPSPLNVPVRVYQLLP